MLSTSLPASLYDQLHPPGWCLVAGLEERHRDTWATLRHRIVEADTRARTLLQILVIIQVSAKMKIMKPSTLQITALITSYHSKMKT